MAEFNLIDEDWIPCISLDGNSVTYGIQNTLLRAHELREVCDDSPLVTVAIHRLLLAILYRAHGGPQNFADWKRLHASGAFNRQTVTDYLNKWRDRFYLIADSYPFFQMAQLETKKAASVTRLATERASGNNATLFDHSGDDDEAEWLPAQTAKALIACQSFALGFGVCGAARIANEDAKLPHNFVDAMALRGMNIWLQGMTLFDTLMINLSPTTDHSLPPWELDNPHAHRDTLDGKDRKAVAAFGIVDRLTWQSRLVRLLPQDGSFSKMYFTQGRSADKSPGDPMKVYRTSKEEGISAVPLSSGKAAWRDAHSILMIPPANSNERRPECFNLAARTGSAAGQVQTQFVTHVVGLASAPNKAGKFLLWRHERMPVPAALLSDPNLIERLGGLIQNAELAAIELNYRTRRIAKLYLAPDAESPNGRNADPDEITKVADATDPRPAYWARMEGHFFALLENLPMDWDVEHDGWKPDAQQAATNAWRGHVKREAQRALEESIRSLGTTARAIQAVARVRTDFNDNELMPRPQQAAKAKRKSKGGKKK